MRQRITEARRTLRRLVYRGGELAITADAFKEQWSRRFGSANPEKMNVPFWLEMVRVGRVMRAKPATRWMGPMRLTSAVR